MTTTLTAAAKPRLRGWLHAVAFPMAIAAGVLLIALSPSAGGVAATAIYTVTSALLFGTSALYHRSVLSPRGIEVLRRMDHSNIYLIIAGTYTPFAVLALSDGARLAVLLTIWIGAAAGVIFRTVWLGAPRWLYTSLYIGLGWVAVLFIPQFLNGVGLAAVVLIIVGGLSYSGGAVVYALKRPDPWPRWFGFHEVFHSLTIAGYACQWTAVLLVVLAAR
ncbi:MAG TPA: hemolysin III family protein [Stackebrandtia sp.]|jgi:hemolysin III|uniref:PAQR family membrane homeostasis protein TrhA n=1 Tax=Stackebrandtia sp. TaxID=2023065 RepID=UPI002D65FD89|nr:hemolysin III family protein [Stackebrandtia sp.]HZE41155.1 hemolysin III family protein [Stackebrandtia sp.]